MLRLLRAFLNLFGLWLPKPRTTWDGGDTVWDRAVVQGLTDWDRS